MIGPKTRALAGFAVYNVWAAGMLVYGLVGYLIRDWRILQTVVTLPGLLILPFLWWVYRRRRMSGVGSNSGEVWVMSHYKVVAVEETVVGIVVGVIVEVVVVVVGRKTSNITRTV